MILLPHFAACNGNVNDSSLVSFARGVLRQSLGQERKPVPKDSQLFLGNGSVTFTFNATTEAGFPRRLWCVSSHVYVPIHVAKQFTNVFFFSFAACAIWSLSPQSGNRKQV